MIKKLDWYLLKSFFTALFVVILAIGLTIIIINMIEELQDFIDHKIPLLEVLQYYAFFGGWVVKSFLPMFILLATLFSVSMLARRREIMAMKASGLSLYRITLPYFIAACLLAVGHFYYNEYVFPPLNQRKIEIKEFTIEKRSKEAFVRVRNIYRQISPGYFYTIASFDADRGDGKEIRVYRTANNKLSRIITAESIKYRDYKWIAEKGVVRDFDSSAQESFGQFDSLILSDIVDKPDDFSRKVVAPQEMGLVELQRYIDLMKRTGGPYVRESVDLKLKYAFPMTSIIIVLICVPFASNPRRSGIAVSISMGATIALLYFILFRIMQSAGYNEKVPEYIAVWGINALFLLIGIILMIGARK
jgi:LPS export ABC transporter permease LptG